MILSDAKHVRYMGDFTNEGHVKPEGKPVNCSWAEHVELKRDLNSVQVCLMGSLKKFGFEICTENIDPFSL